MEPLLNKHAYVTQNIYKNKSLFELSMAENENLDSPEIKNLKWRAKYDSPNSDCQFQNGKIFDRDKNFRFVLYAITFTRCKFAEIY